MVRVSSGSQGNDDAASDVHSETEQDGGQPVVKKRSSALFSKAPDIFRARSSSALSAGMMSKDSGTAPVYDSEQQNCYESQRPDVASSVGRRSSLGSDDTALRLLVEQHQTTWASRCFPRIFGGKPGEPEDEDDDSLYSEDEDGVWTKQTKGAKQQHKLSPSELRAIHSRVLEKLGVSEDGGPEPFSVRLQRCLGILQLRIIIGVKRLRVEEEPPYYPSARSLVSSLRFEAVVGVLILVNAALIGWDTMFSENEKKPWMLVISEHVFTFIFVVEFFLRIMSYSWVWVFQPMNMFDVFVVWIVGVLTTWVLVPSGVDVDVLQRFAALRILRLARLCRAIRMIPIFHELWMLVKGVMECISLLFWAGVIVGTVHFMFAVATMELVAKSEQFKDDSDVQYYFGSLFPSIFTLFQIMTFDSWAGIVRPIIYKAPETAIIFFLFMGIAGIVLVNLMTAIVVKNAFDALEEDEEAVAQQKKLQHMKIQRELYDMFRDLDEDGSGQLSKEEFTDVLDDVLFIRKMKVMDIDLEELPDIFDILDDGDGAISMDEFCMGLMRMQGVAMSRDMLKATQKMKQINQGFLEVSEDLSAYAEDTIDQVEDNLERTHEHFLEMQALTAEVLKKLDQIGLRKVLNESTMLLPTLPNPSLEAVLGDLKKGAKQKVDLQAQTIAVTVPPAEPPEGCMKALPATWTLRRRDEQREAARKQRKMKKATRPKQQLNRRQSEDDMMGVPLQFRDEWASLQVSTELPPLPPELTTLRTTAGGPGGAAAGEQKVIRLPASLVASLGASPAPASPAAPAPPAGSPPTVQAEDASFHPNAVPSEDYSVV